MQSRILCLRTPSGRSHLQGKEAERRFPVQCRWSLYSAEFVIHSHHNPMDLPSVLFGGLLHLWYFFLCLLRSDRFVFQP